MCAQFKKILNEFKNLTIRAKFKNLKYVRTITKNTILHQKIQFYNYNFIPPRSHAATRVSLHCSVTITEMKWQVRKNRNVILRSKKKKVYGIKITKKIKKI